jgi:hypothetical protein
MKSLYNVKDYYYLLYRESKAEFFRENGKS